LRGQLRGIITTEEFVEDSERELKLITKKIKELWND
jgi:hypothetical protein